MLYKYSKNCLSQKIETRVAKEPGLCVIFLESVCDDPEIIAANVALKVSSGDPDYKDTSREEAKHDFLRRIREYESVYQTITEPHLSYIRISNVGHEVTINRIRTVIYCLSSLIFSAWFLQMDIFKVESHFTWWICTWSPAASTCRGYDGILNSKILVFLTPGLTAWRIPI